MYIQSLRTIYSWSRQGARGWDSKLKRIEPWATGGVVSSFRESGHSKVVDVVQGGVVGGVGEGGQSDEKRLLSQRRNF